MNLGWSHNYKASFAKAQKSNKVLYVLITSEDCGWCRKFERTTLQDKAIKQRLKSEFEVVHLSREKDEVPKMFKTSPIPRHYFVAPSGKIVYDSLGHRGVACFESFMDEAQGKQKSSN